MAAGAHAISDDLLQNYTAPPLSGQEKYHAFISHCSEDLEYSKFLKEELENKAGLKCFHSDDDFQCGATIVDNIMDGINRSRRVIVIISENMLDSKWVGFEVANSRSKAHEKGKVILIPVLHNITPAKVPAYVKEINYLEENDSEFWPKLLRSLTEDIPLTATIPAGNIAHGISWSYFYGYLSFVLPGLDERTLTSEYAQKGIPILSKMVIVLPETCNCPGDVRTVDPNVTHAGFIKFKASRAGKRDREYNSSVYHVKDPDNGEEYFTIMEFATPLQSMYEMEQGRIASLDREEKLRQMELFKLKMNEILHHSSNTHCHNKAVLLPFRDQGRQQQQPERLARVLADCIRRELTKAQVDAAMDQ